jgi:uncharacterized repeat protein (TIGR01451 family)/CSLREA domain-containing protein
MKRMILLVLACGIPLVMIVALATWMNTSARPAEALNAGHTYTVNTSADTPDADVGDGLCADASGHCSLRAAIMQANFVTGVDTITLPAGVFLLTRPGDDDAAVLGDLDITDDLTIQGAGSRATIVDGNGAVTGDRVFQVLASAKNTLFSGLTIRNGKKTTNTFDEGGGLYWDGGGSQLRFTDVVIEDNAANYGGGLYLNYSTSVDTVDFDQVIIHANKAAQGAGGGMGANFSDFATFILLAGQIYSNTAYEGGGLFFQGKPQFGLSSVRIVDSSIYSNTASLSGGMENFSGDPDTPVVIRDSQIYKNHALFYGGAIGNYGTLEILTTNLEANSAGLRGGGLYGFEGGQASFINSIFKDNSAQMGGGIFSDLFINNKARLTLTNSTLSGNAASFNGGGIYAKGGHLQLANTTVAGNYVHVPMGIFYAGMGGGIYITATAEVTAQNSILADNTRRIHLDLPVPDDCLAVVASLQSLGYNLIGTADNCLITGTPLGNITGQDPRLGPLQFNGGRTQTRQPLPGSPAIDAGQTPACLDANNLPLTGDQRGYPRPFGGRCDIGAVEAQPDLALQASVSPTEASPGETVSFTLAFSNTGTLPAGGVVLTGSLPAQIKITGVISSGAAITPTGLTAPFVWQVQNLNYAQGGAISLTGVVQPGVPTGPITTTVRIASSPPDPDPFNNLAQAVLKVVNRNFYLPLLVRR